MTLQIIPVAPHLVAVPLGLDITIPAVAYLGIDDGEIVGGCGLAWGEGKCWLWFTMEKPKAAYARAVIRKAQQLKRKARQLGERHVWVIRDPQFETSARLCALCGFEFSEIWDGHELHVCDV